MTFKNYQLKSKETAIYPKEIGLLYTTLGLVGEAGEIANKVKKIVRDKGGILTEDDKQKIGAEVGDVLWYLANLALELDLTLDGIAEDNLKKLFDRKERGVLSGNGDKR